MNKTNDENRGGARKGAGRKSNMQKELETWAAQNDTDIETVQASVKDGLLTTLQTVSGAMPIILSNMIKRAQTDDDLAKFLVTNFLKYATLDEAVKAKSPMDDLMATMKLTLEKAKTDGILPRPAMADFNGKSIGTTEGAA